MVWSRLVLVADDDRNMRQSAVRTLLDKGLAVIEAEDGGGAVAMAMRYSPCLIVMNGLMPVCDGIEATARLRANGYGGLIFMDTAWDRNEIAARAFAAGVDAYYGRPHDTQRLYDDIENALLQAPL
jgi:CheY-like chemotaxis protein